MVEWNKDKKPVKACDLAELFGVCRETVDNWIDRGLEAFQPGGSGPIYIARESLDKFFVPVKRAHEKPRSSRPVSSSRAMKSLQEKLGI